MRKTPEQVLTEWASDEIAFDLGQGPITATRKDMIHISKTIMSGELNLVHWDYSYKTYFCDQWSAGMLRKCMGNRATGPWLAAFSTMMEAALYAIFDDTDTPHKMHSWPTVRELSERGEL